MGLSQFLRNFSAPQQNQEPEKKEAKEKQPEQQLQSNLASLTNWDSLANLEVLSPLSWGLQLWRQPSHFWRLSPRLARTILPRLVTMGRSSLNKEITRQRKSKCRLKRKRPRKKTRTLSQKKKGMETQDDIKEDSDFEVIPEVSPKPSIYPTLPSEEQTRLWKTNL